MPKVRNFIFEIQKLKDKAIQGLLNERSKIDEQLRELGWKGGKGKASTASASTGTKRASDPNKVCKICGKTATELGVERHDARSHRSETVGKKGGGKKKKGTAATE